jgi:hypothetical protein
MGGVVFAVELEFDGARPVNHFARLRLEAARGSDEGRAFFGRLHLGVSGVFLSTNE